MFRSMIDSVKEMEKQFEELKLKKTQSEQVLAAVVKKVGEVDILFTDLFKSDIDKVQLIVDKSNPERLKVTYDENFVPINQTKLGEQKND